MLRTGAGVMAGVPAACAFGDVRASPAAADQPPIGTWPAGASGNSVFIGISVPRTGTYAVQGEDELKGYQLAIEHINAGHPLIKQISPKTTKGVLGKELKYGVADSAAKPNDAVQAQQRFITENKAIMITGGTSSAVAVALNKLAQREKVLFVCGISGSNDTTGKDCVRYGVRQNFYGETAANAIGPALLKAYGKNKKAAFMTPDYTYGHTVTKSVNDYLTKNGGWQMVTNQVSPLGAPDFSSYLTNIANSGAEFLINVNWGHDAVLSTQQAKQFGLLPKMKLVIPYQIPFLAARSAPRLTEGVYAATDFWWTLRGQVPAGEDVRRGVREEVRLQARVGRRERLHGVRALGRGVEHAGTLLSARRDQVVRVAAQAQLDASARCSGAPTTTSSSARSIIVKGKAPKDMKNKEDYWEVVEVVPGRRADAEARRLRLQPRLVHLTPPLRRCS